MALTPDDPTKAQAWISGTPPDQTIDFYIPRGNIGPQGPRGPIGPSVSVGTVETNMGPAAPGTVGPQGLPGPKGDPGGLVAGTIITDGTDYNALIAPGIYRTMGHTGHLNGPGIIYGYMYVDVTEDNVRVNQTFYPTNTPARNFLQRALIGGSWTPWRSFSSSRVDQTAGRAIYQWDSLNNREQLIYGDTGWRSILDMFPTRNYGRIEVRRIGSIVYLLMEAAAFTDSAPGLTKVFDLGSGWSSEATVLLPIDNAAEDSVLHRVKASWNGQHELKFRSGFGFQGMVSWVTKDPWPTTLPGTASGTIPNT